MPKLSEPENEILIIASKMKEVVHALECLSSGDLLDAVSDAVREMLRKAAARAKENGRTTIRPCDL